ncbi:MAG: hypothetical protein II119_02215 [Bacilli bacterium]|nr:hypothetical protein [Bacilli bacterium]MBQ6282862.1 hypothetical protein [Bacilli bacterium]
MFKKVLLLITCIILLTGCSKTIEKFYLSDEFYNEGTFIKIKSDDLDNYKDKNYVIFTYNNFCSLSIPCDEIFQKSMTNNKIDFLSITFEEFKKTELYNIVKYAPSVIIVKDNKIVAYLDAEKNNDLEKYQDVDKFTEWLSNYIYLKK